MKPLYDAFRVDDEGHLWVRGFPPSAASGAFDPEPEDGPETWQLFDPEGRWLGGVEIPAGLRVDAIRDGYVMGQWRDALDVERIRLHRILKP